MFSEIALWKILVLVSLSSTPIWAATALGAAQKGTTVGGVAKELAKLGIYGQERAVMVINRGTDWLRLWCASRDDSTGEQQLDRDEYIAFKFKPLIIGGYTVFWCTTDYKSYWARWDVFGKDAKYGFDNENDKEYIFEIRHEGVRYKEKKIRGLAEGQHRYTLWENYDEDKNPYGESLEGYVDSDMCNNIPGWMETKTAAVTLCDNSCITLYDSLHCRGETSRLEAGEGCTNFWLTHFRNRARSLKGC